jgi:enoyl-CoA hydratase
VEQKGRVGLVTLNRPKQLNALSPGLMAELGAALRALDADAGIGAIVLTGNEKAFAAGADIAAMKDFSYMHAYLTDYVTDWEHFRSVRKPVIAAVAGYALGGGNELAMQCDIMIAAENASSASLRSTSASCRATAARSACRATRARRRPWTWASPRA